MGRRHPSRRRAAVLVSAFVGLVLCGSTSAAVRVTDTGYVDAGRRGDATLIQRKLAIKTGKTVFEFTTNGDAIGMTKPSLVNWYGAEFFTVRVNGRRYFGYNGMARKKGFAEKTKFRAGADKEWGWIEAAQEQSQGKVTVTLKARVGDDKLMMTVRVEPRAKLRSTEVGFQCFPNTMAPREKLRRAVATAKRRLVNRPGQRVGTVALSRDERWVFIHDDAYDLGALTVGDSKATGGCAILYAPSECKSAAVGVGGYHVDPVFTFGPRVREMHFVLLDFGWDKKNADALDSMKRLKAPWLQAYEDAAARAAANLAPRNYVPPATSAMDAKPALKDVIYLRPGADVQAKPEDFYRIVGDRPYRGAGCMAVTAYGPKRHAVIVKSSEGSFKKGDRLTASAYLRADDPMTVAVFIWTTNMGPEGLRAVEQLRELHRLRPGWAQCSVTGKLTRDAKYAWILITSIHNDRLRRTFCVDEVKLERGGVATPSRPGPELDTTTAAGSIYPTPFCAKPPKVDGKLDDACWRGALCLDTFIVNDGKTSPAPQKNEVRITYDDKNVYLASRCAEKDLGLLSHRSPARDRPDWGDDRIEFFFDALGAGRSPTYYFSVNSFGVTVDQYIGVGGWDPDVKLATGREKSAWTLEAAIPIREFGRDRLTGQRWGMNVGRHHRGTFRDSSSLVRLEGKFNQPGRFVRLVFTPPPPPGKLRVVSLSRGAVSRAGFRTGANLAVYEVRNDGPPRTLRFAIRNQVGGETRRRENLTRRIGRGKTRVGQYYRVLGLRGEAVVFEVADDKGKRLFHSANDLSRIRPAFRVYELKDPLFKPLLAGGRKKDPRIDGDMIWGMPLVGYEGALQAAHPYSYDRIRRELTDSRSHFLLLYCPMLPSVDKDFAERILRRSVFLPHLAESRRRGWAQPVLYAPYYVIGVDAKGRKGASFYNSTGWLPDPINRKAYVDVVKDVLDKHGKDLWAVHAGDEQWGRQSAVAQRFFMKHYDPGNPDHAWFRKALQEIKRDYGFGKFGAHFRMKADAPTYPYCRRAYLTWLSDKVRQANRELSRAVKTRFPRMPVIAEDSHGGSVVDVEYWSEYADAGPFQAQYSPDPTTQGYAYVTKLAKDLSCLDYILVCPHDCVAGFPTGALEAEELRELYSQIFRVGGTGFNFWPASYGEKKPSPPLAMSLQAGYPLAWRYMIEVAKLARKLPLLKFPKPDAAVFISTESAKCGADNRGRNLALFTYLGPNARGWFRFISEAPLDLKRVRLADFPMVFAPSMRYARRDTGEALMRYVERGGVLISCDPLIWSNDITSASMADLREKVFGVRVGKQKAAARRLAFTQPLVAGVRELPVETEKERAYDVKVVGPNARVLARFDDGRPALVENRLGRGRALYFAWSPLSSATRKHAAWRRFFTKWYASLGGRTGHDIWRFKIPPLVEDEEKDPKGVCLTGNYGFWDRYKFIVGRRFNRDVGGEYALESRGRRDVYPFKTGRLTNRPRLREMDVYGKVHPLIWRSEFSPVRWVEELRGPGAARITFDFKKARPLLRVRLYYAGAFPGAKLSTSRDGASWSPCSASARAAKTGEKEVAFQDVTLAKPTPARYLRLELSPKGRLLLPEVEVWGEESGKP